MVDNGLIQQLFKPLCVVLKPHHAAESICIGRRGLAWCVGVRPQGAIPSSYLFLRIRAEALLFHRASAAPLRSYCLCYHCPAADARLGLRILRAVRSSSQDGARCSPRLGFINTNPIWQGVPDPMLYSLVLCIPMGFGSPWILPWWACIAE